MKKLLRRLLVAVVALAVLAVCVRVGMVWWRSRDLMPELVDVPPGPRAPTRDFLGLEVARTTLPAAEVVFRGVGADCKDSSMRALMQARRRKVKDEMAAAEARGEDPDAVTGASLADYKSKKERNPQVRLSCEAVPVEAFADRPRAPGEPLYWLLVFDSADLPLRHTSVTRRIADPGVAALEWRSAVDAMTKRFGAPASAREPPPDGSGFGPGSWYAARWEFADLVAEVSAFRVGASIRMTERVEVPWPVRTDG